MSFQLEIDEQARRIHVRSAARVLDGSQLEELFARIRLSGADVATFDVLVDFRSVERIPGVSPEGIAALALVEPRAEAGELASKRLAVVLGNDEVHRLAVSLQDLLRRARPGLRLFHDIAEATAYFERRPAAGRSHGQCAGT